MGVSKATSGEILAYGLDFKGGTAMTVTFPEGTTPTIGELETAVRTSIGKEAVVNLVKDTNAAMVKTEELSEDQRNALVAHWVSNYGASESEIEIQSISGTVSGEMKKDAILAVAVATVLMLIYIWIRFKDINFGTSAVLVVLLSEYMAITFCLFDFPDSCKLKHHCSYSYHSRLLYQCNHCCV